MLLLLALPPIISPMELLYREPPLIWFCRTSGGSRLSSTFEMNTSVNHSGFSSTQRGQLFLSHSRTWGLMDCHWWLLNEMIVALVSSEFS